MDLYNYVGYCYSNSNQSLGRIPYGDVLPAGNYALLRIEENLVGIGVAIILTLIIFPVFVIDLLKDNIQSKLKWRLIMN